MRVRGRDQGLLEVDSRGDCLSKGLSPESFNQIGSNEWAHSQEPSSALCEMWLLGPFLSTCS